MSLTTYLATLPAAPFDWPTRNCCHFAARWVKTREGFDPMEGLDPTEDAEAARAQINALGGDLARAWAIRMRREPIEPQWAQQGDVVIVPANVEGGLAAGICTGDQIAVLLESGAIGFFPLKVGRCAWRVA